MAAEPNQPPARRRVPDEPLSVFGILRCALRRPGTVLVAMVGATALAGLFLRFQRPVFESEALLHLDSPSLGGSFGDLGRLVNLGSSPVVEGEIAALEARSLAEATAVTPDGAPVPTPDAPGYDRRPGLTTLVHDSANSVFANLRRRTGNPPADGRPLVVPEGRVFASMTPTRDDAPRKVAVSFPRPYRVRCSTPSLLAKLRLADTYPEELDYAPGEPFTYRGATLRLVPRGNVGGRTFVVESLSRYEAVDRLQRVASAGESARGSGVLRVTVRDSDPRRAQETLAALCNNYLDGARRRSQRSPDLSVAHIEKLLDEQQAAYEAAQQAILEIQSETPEVLVVPEVAQGLVQRLSDLELTRVRLETGQRALTEITTKLGKGDLTALALLDGGTGGGFVGSLGLTVDPLTASYVERIALLEAQIVELEQLYSENYPDLAERRAEVDALVTGIRDQLAARTANLGTELANVEARLGEERRALLALPGRSAQLVQPMLAVRTYEELVPFLTQSLHAAEISTSAAAISAEYYDEASLPTSMASPSVGRILVAGAALGLLLGLAIAFYREPRRGKLRRWSEVESELGIEVLGTAPIHPRAPQPPADGPLATALLSPPDAPAADAYRHLRARLDSAARGATGPLLVAGVGARAGAGCSTTNRNLAIAWARHGERTLLVDADLGAPTVQRSFGVPDGPGLAALLRREITLADAVRPTDLPTLHVLPAGSAQEHAGDVVAGASVATLRDALAAAAAEDAPYDRVVLDLPPTLDGATTADVAGNLDAVVLVARARRSRKWQLHACLQGLTLVEAPLRGVFVNGTRGRGAAHPAQGGRP